MRSVRSGAGKLQLSHRQTLTHASQMDEGHRLPQEIGTQGSIPILLSNNAYRHDFYPCPAPFAHVLRIGFSPYWFSRPGSQLHLLNLTWSLDCVSSFPGAAGQPRRNQLKTCPCSVPALLLEHRATPAIPRPLYSEVQRSSLAARLQEPESLLQTAKDGKKRGTPFVDSKSDFLFTKKP